MFLSLCLKNAIKYKRIECRVPGAEPEHARKTLSSKDIKKNRATRLNKRVCDNFYYIATEAEIDILVLLASLMSLNCVN